MNSLELKKFFEIINYDYKKDFENLKKIILLTKTRKKISNVATLPYGCEQTFLIKAIAQYKKSTNLFEIGSGRGTAAFAVSLENSIQEVISIDILRPNIPRFIYVNYKKKFISLNKLKKLVPFPQTNKIIFKHISETNNLIEKYKGSIDLVFIDGNHTDIEIINNDINIALKLLSKNGVIIFDDYDFKEFSVKKVVDNFLQTNPDFDALFIQFRGHLFDLENKELTGGIVLVSKKKLFN